MEVPLEKSGQGAEVEELGLVSSKVVLSPGSHCSDLGGMETLGATGVVLSVCWLKGRKSSGARKCSVICLNPEKEGREARSFGNL